VEVSGWDTDRHFFVEKTSLYMDRSGDRTVILRNQLRTGLLVFIRLTTTTFAGKTYPRVYRVELAELPDHAGFSKVCLTPSQPRHELSEDATSESSEHLIQQWNQIRVKV
jgi:hypothetical protein